jgi:hypothetical protein
VQGKESIGIHMFIKEGREGTSVSLIELLQELMLRDAALDQQGVDEPQAVLEELETQRRRLLLVPTIGGKDALSPLAEKILGGVPPFHHISPFVALITEGKRGQIRTDYVELSLSRGIVYQMLQQC